MSNSTHSPSLTDVMSMQELWLCSRLVYDFGDESSVMTADGAFCTKWLKSLKKLIGSLIFTPENEARSNTSAFQFAAQPSSIPGSVLQLLGPSYLVRASSWEMYGSAPLARINALAFATCFADSSRIAYSKLIQHLAVYKGYQAKEKFSCISKSRILLLKLQLLHECALHRGHLKLAQQFCDDMELKTKASLRHARTLLAANQYSQVRTYLLVSW